MVHLCPGPELTDEIDTEISVLAPVGARTCFVKSGTGTALFCSGRKIGYEDVDGTESRSTRTRTVLVEKGSG